MRSRLTFLLFVTLPATAAVVRGRVTTVLAGPVPGARVQLIALTGGTRTVASAITGIDGTYELRTPLGGRFLLLTAPTFPTARLAPQIGTPFYCGRADLFAKDVSLDPTLITPQLSTLSGQLSVPRAQLASGLTQLAPDQLLTRTTFHTELPEFPSTLTLRLGPAGAPDFVYVRGAAPSATAIFLDGQNANDLGGAFDFSALSTAGFASLSTTPALELLPAPSPRLDAQAATLALHTQPAALIRPALVYAGDAGPLNTVRQEVTASAAPTRADLTAVFSRFDTTSSDSPADPSSPFHLSTLSTNLGYHISAGTSLRLLARRDVAAFPQASPFLFFNLQPADKQSTQNLFATFVFSTLTSRGWHNAGSYALARKRAQLQTFATPLAGLPITITGANGYTAKGTALFPQHPPREDGITDRDTFAYQTDYPFKSWLIPSFEAHYQQAKAADLLPTLSLISKRQHLAASLRLDGEFARHRLFYQVSGFLDHSNLLGVTGAPGLGLTYVPVRPGSRVFRGTTLHAIAAGGLREPSLLEQASLQVAGRTSATPTNRAFSLSVDQVIVAKLTLRVAYFHNQFAHDFEPVAQSLAGRYTYAQTLAYRTQGLESEALYQPFPRLSFHAAYTYLAALTEQSSAPATLNPNFPSSPIGALTALPGARPFHRPPNSGSARVQFSATHLSLSFDATAQGRSDDSTALLATPTLLLPNRNLSPGFTALSANASYAITRHVTAYTQLTNLLDNRHLSPIGYTSTPFLVRTGLRLSFGGE